LNFRPIVATEGHTVNTFKELCPEKYQDSSKVPPVITTVNSINTSFTTITVPAVIRPELLVIYNASQISRSEADALVLDTVRTCFVEIHDCQYCSSQFSKDSCSFQPITTESPISSTNQAEVTTPVVSPDDRVYFGAVTITIMATSGCFLLALTLWAADYVRKATTKKSKFKRKARKSEIEETQH
ncbi:uncharacterized protein LOC134275180, partial [Saccostrea cucullata]|uniref:uncharacterized protein LOC134275180 n=1 Tax=Saccostrea cuccullata TaxID=36930 RepID=UPI002ED32118